MGVKHAFTRDELLELWHMLPREIHRKIFANLVTLIDEDFPRHRIEDHLIPVTIHIRGVVIDLSFQEYFVRSFYFNDFVKELMKAWEDYGG